MMKARLILSILCVSLSLVSAVQAQDAGSGNPPLLMPIGGGYSDIYAGFAEAAVARAQNNTVNILVLPIAYATKPDEISQAEMNDNLEAAEARRFQIEEACKRAAAAEMTCSAVLAPVLVRADAKNPEMLQYFQSDLAAVFILGGDQTIAMQVIQDTPFEAALQAAYEGGTLVAGTSAGGAVQSRIMLGGYNQNYATNQSLDFGAVDVWLPPARRGLPFGLQGAILDQHFYQRSRFGRLLNAITLPEAAHVGVGVDAYTGVNAPQGKKLERVFGLYTVTVLDAETYHAADSVQYRGPQHTLSLRNVLVHLLSPGDVSYDLVTRQHSLGAPAPQVKREFSGLALPPGAGTLILTGDLSDLQEKNPVMERFMELAGGEAAHILILASGYPSDSSAQRAADKIQTALPVKAEVIVVPAEDAQPVALPKTTSGIILIGRDQSKIQPQMLGEVQIAWRSGVHLLADDAGAAILGSFYSAHGPTPGDVEDEEAATQKSFLDGRTTLQPGLGLLEANFEPRLMGDNRWGRWFSLAYNQPKLLAIGLNEGGAVEIGAQGAVALGQAPLLALDLRQARLALGSNEGLVIANGLLDVFAPGDRVQPQAADINAMPTRQPTPSLETPTPLPTQTAALPTATPTSPAASVTKPPTATASPTVLSDTATPAAPTLAAQPADPNQAAQPPTDSGSSRIKTLILLAVAAAAALLASLWLRRQRGNPQK